MLDKNLIAGFLIAAATLMGVSIPSPALAQRYYGYLNQNAPMRFNQQVPYQQNGYQQVPCQQGSYQSAPYQQAPFQLNAYQQGPYQPAQYQQVPYQGYQQPGYQLPGYQQPGYQTPVSQGLVEPYTPNINGVPIDPNTPRAGLDKHGFDGAGHAYNNFTQPYYGY